MALPFLPHRHLSGRLLSDWPFPYLNNFPDHKQSWIFWMSQDLCDPNPIISNHDTCNLIIACLGGTVLSYRCCWAYSHTVKVDQFLITLSCIFVDTSQHDEAYFFSSELFVGSIQKPYSLLLMVGQFIEWWWLSLKAWLNCKPRKKFEMKTMERKDKK